MPPRPCQGHLVLRLAQCVLCGVGFLLSSTMTHAVAGCFALVMLFLLTFASGVYSVYIVRRQTWKPSQSIKWLFEIVFLILLVTCFAVLSATSSLFTCSEATCTWAYIVCIVVALSSQLQVLFIYDLYKTPKPVLAKQQSHTELETPQYPLEHV
ncbi:unnamed protein product [Aphanomyces euteiches]